MSGAHAAADPVALHAHGLRRILTNAASLFLAYVLPRLLTIGAVVVAARVLGTNGFGQYGTASAYAVIVSIVATLGMQPLLIREMARDPARAGDWLRAAHWVKAGSNALMLLMLVGAGRWIFAYPPDVMRAALLLGVAYAIAAWAENLGAWYQSVERMGVWMQASALAGLITGGLGVAAVVVTRSLEWFCAAGIAGQLAGLAWLVARMPRLPVAAGVRTPVRPLLAALAPFAAAFVALTLHSKIDVLMLERYWPAAEVGVYSAAHKFIDIVQALAIVGAAAVYPRLSRASAPGKAGARLIELTLLAGVLTSGALFLARDGLVYFLFGADYGGAVLPTALLAAGVAPLAINIVGGYVLAAAGHMKPVAILYTVAVLLKVALNAWLVPAYGASGTAGAMMVTETVLAAGMLVLLQSRAGALPSRRAVLSAVLAVAVCGGLSAVQGSPTIGLVSATVFVFAAIVLFSVSGGVPRADRQLLMAALRFPPRAAAERGP